MLNDSSHDPEADCESREVLLVGGDGTMSAMSAGHEASGMAARCVASSEAALAACRERVPDVVVIDADACADLALALRDARATRNVALIAIAARIDGDDRQAILTGPFDAWLPMPVDPCSLLDLVDQLAVSASRSARGIFR